MKKKERRQLGAHYTSEKNILKVIKPLFLDDLEERLDHLLTLRRGRVVALQQFQDELSKLRILDPACGCGNFLIVTYREIRRLELKALKFLVEDDQLSLDAKALSKVDVDQFYGIEIEEFPARIAEVAMWMMDHIVNVELSNEFGPVFTRIPLKKSPHINPGNALQTDWNDVLPAADCSYIIGNPPFVGHQYRDDDQQADMHRIWGKKGQVNRLDYVTCWFKLAVD